MNRHKINVVLQMLQRVCNRVCSLISPVNDVNSEDRDIVPEQANTESPTATHSASHTRLESLGRHRISDMESSHPCARNARNGSIRTVRGICLGIAA